jgi:hypothetical protein
MPTSAWCEDGPRIELPVSVPSPTAPKLAATAAAVPPLEPALTRSSAYGFFVYPGRTEFTVSYGLNANSAMFDFASTIAPAARTLRTWNASRPATKPSRDSEPAVVVISIVSKLSLTMIGTQCSGPTGPDRENRASSESATRTASGLTTVSELSAGPFLS